MMDTAEYGYGDSVDEVFSVQFDQRNEEVSLDDVIALKTVLGVE